MQAHLAEWHGRMLVALPRMLRRGRPAPMARIKQITYLITLLHDIDRADAMQPDHFCMSHHRKSCPWHPSRASLRVLA